MKLPHQKSDIACESFQRLEDLATAYWYSEVLFAALELNIFGLLGDCFLSADDLREKSEYDLDALSRLLASLAALGLLAEHEGKYANGPLASRYLVPGRSSYLGDFLLYRRYLTSHWQRLAARIRHGVSANDRPSDERREAYQERTFAYVKTMDLQAELKAAEAMGTLENMLDREPRWILDLGGGAGAWCRAFRKRWPNAREVLFDLPETLSAAERLYPDPSSWGGIEMVAGNALTPCLRGKPFDLILMSNVLHAYGPEEAGKIMKYSAGCLAPGGTVMVHDYLADLHDVDPVKGSLYDLHMLINTYNGRIYRLDELKAMAEAAGLKSLEFFHLQSDTSVLLAQQEGPREPRRMSRDSMLVAQAKRLGFSLARVIDTSEIVLKPWVRLKCQFGCSLYGRSSSCPPYSLSEEKMRAILSGYKHALLVQGTPPSSSFHEQLLDLERTLFLAGHHDALALGAGPCPVCSSCPADGACRFPEKARPSLEACGVDVYETARRAGLSIAPVTDRLGYVKYFGLVLFGNEGNCASIADSGDFNSRLR